ncbi:MAG: hypothetical protein RL346_372 [Verrucomicrobiota bacterium]
MLEIGLDNAKNELQLAITLQENSVQISSEMDWLAEHEPQPADYQTIQEELQKFVVGEAGKVGLTVKKQNFNTTDTSGTHFHRVQIIFNVSGREESLYRWLHAINEPTALRAASQILLSPNTDDTLIDCEAVVSQWFIPNKAES